MAQGLVKRGDGCWRCFSADLNMLIKKIKKIIFLTGLSLFILIVAWLYSADFGRRQPVRFGVTFSQKYAESLKLNPYHVLTAILDDLQIKKFRLIAYWDEIEKTKDQYDFTKLDWQLKEVGKRGGEVILAIGHRLPRWPECHWPGWTYQLSEAEREQQINKLLTVLINRYKSNTAITAWQVENEPFLRVFGECPRPNYNFYKQELLLVRSLDSRPIVITESGELSTWLRAAKLADYVGTSIYRITWNKTWGYFYYPLPPAYYYLKAQIVKLLTPAQKIFVSEMQMEPWLGMPVIQTSLSEQYRSMNARQFQKNISYVKRTGLDPVYLWGVEWWYWLKEQGNNSLWEQVKKLNN